MKRLRNRKFTNHKKKMIYYSLFGLLLIISIGYAYLQAALSINGNTTIAANTWDIHFENLSITNGSVAASTPAAINGNSTSISYTVLLSKPGDYYEFSVDTVNAGTIPAKVSLVNLQGITSEAEPYLETSYKYESGLPIAVGDLLNPGARKRILVRVTYKEDLNSLPDTDIPLNLTFDIDYSQTKDLENNVGNLLQTLKKDGNTCIEKYDGDVTDQAGQTVTATNVYFNNCENERNIIFGGFCWKTVRTTESGGLKLMYNGEVVDGKCESTRGDHKGIVGEKGEEQVLNTEYLYGSGFTYNTANNTFTLTDTEAATWSDSTYEDLISKYTCKNLTGTCTTIINIQEYVNDTTAFVSTYSIDDVPARFIGESPYNSANDTISSIAYSGYMFNKVYPFEERQIDTFYVASNFIYENYINAYELTDDIEIFYSSTFPVAPSKRYTCFDDTGECSSLYYIFWLKSINPLVFYSQKMENGKDINDLNREMISGSGLNRYNSSIKGVVDSWYANNLHDYTSQIEDVVYCNDRSVKNWMESDTSEVVLDYNAYDRFNNFENESNFLKCNNLSDQFAMSNNSAKLTYPIGLITGDELYFFNQYEENLEFESYYTLTPLYYSNNTILLYGDTYGVDYNSGENLPLPVRPVISLKGENIISSGTGTEEDPWIVE